MNSGHLRVLFFAEMCVAGLGLCSCVVLLFPFSSFVSGRRVGDGLSVLFFLCFFFQVLCFLRCCHKPIEC